MHRYLILIWNPGNIEGARMCQRLDAGITPTSGWSVAYRGEGVFVMHAGTRAGSAEAYPLAGNRGVVIGALFHRSIDDHSKRQVVTFDGSETTTLLASGGQHLIDNYWGKYVLAFRDPDAGHYHIIRDPTAEMPCFHTRWHGVEIFFSHVDDVVSLMPVTFSVNWTYIAARLTVATMLNAESGLREVRDIPGGTRVTLRSNGQLEQKLLWNPVAFAASNLLEDVAAAQAELRSTVQCVVDAWASCHARILHSLSGGLDSSVVAGCLASAPSRPQVSFWHYFLDLTVDEVSLVPNVSKQLRAKLRRMMGGPDERFFARLVADRWQLPLIEHERRFADMHMRYVRNAPLSVVPSLYVNVADLNMAEVEVAKRCQATAMFSGSAGDQVFYAGLESVGAIDYAFNHRRRPRQLLCQVASASALSRESMWSVLGRSLRYGILRRPMAPVHDRFGNSHFLKDSVAATLDRGYVQHPWEVLAADLPPGKRAHVLGLTGALFYHHRFHRERAAASVAPLISQPVVELALRIPSYTLLAGGVSRGLARRAFSDLLPGEIQQRIMKGSGGGVAQKYVEADMPFIRESLMDGLLAKEGLLDRKKLEDWLRRGQCFSSVTAMTVTTSVAVEEWLRQWAALPMKKAAG